MPHPEKPRETLLTDAETDDLVAFLKDHHPAMHKEIVKMRQMNLHIPNLLRILYDEMVRFRNGKTTKYVAFWI